jgi:hypothetical protein
MPNPFADQLSVHIPVHPSSRVRFEKQLNAGKVTLHSLIRRIRELVSTVGELLNPESESYPRLASRPFTPFNISEG